ncbi:wiskott-Aldrich syndrome protein homolog 1-like [Cebus imitator]|uniref:wiskott-Aldrich syndrome protein homolog 1-like n=1 Tax=Cebus imitator TaxID=2715852 RepID=UPI00189BEE5B|nr:wiskott-Aldrich syndrome protein homolog 1-like [Cebus imitator]
MRQDSGRSRNIDTISMGQRVSRRTDTPSPIFPAPQDSFTSHGFSFRPTDWLTNDTHFARAYARSFFMLQRLGAGCLFPRRDPTGSKLLGNGVSPGSSPVPDQGLQTHTRARPTGPAPPFPESAPRTPRGPIPGEGLASSSFRACPTSAALLSRQGPGAEAGEGHPPGRCHMLLSWPQRPLQVPAPAAVPSAVPSAGPAAPPAARPWPPDVREGSGSPRKFQHT